MPSRAGAAAPEYFETYDLSPALYRVDIGAQPLGYPSGFITAVTRRDRTLKNSLADSQRPGLVPKRIAYVDAANAQYPVLHDLPLAGISDSQAQVMPMGVADMPGALETGSVQAFRAWELATTIAMAKSDLNRIAFRGQGAQWDWAEQVLSDADLAHMLEHAGACCLGDTGYED